MFKLSEKINDKNNLNLEKVKKDFVSFVWHDVKKKNESECTGSHSVISALNRSEAIKQVQPRNPPVARGGGQCDDHRRAPVTGEGSHEDPAAAGSGEEAEGPARGVAGAPPLLPPCAPRLPLRRLPHLRYAALVPIPPLSPPPPPPQCGVGGVRCGLRSRIAAPSGGSMMRLHKLTASFVMGIRVA
jgi:hypothetical protein